ncbi:hypothetical protein LB554_15235 [Mesorhizobium sp. CO1-1-11]|uniref:hypothetical protein n=1 Tax=Mesorhizobium sp. CO1-1-11 TaxID=2876636 RepID=UPI001CC9CF26|nr:hypothetical protein [Mesorhizobium sp. CO1-1-11]MBZ9725304.1 hypothetical protein [Mesorhizobium sp. CO1-1-11]
MSKTKKVRNITDPHELLDWVVDQAVMAGQQITMTDPFLDKIDEFVEQVRSYGYLPAAEFPHVYFFLFLNRLSDPEETPARPRKANADLVELVAFIVADLTVSELDIELYSMVKRFAKLADFDEPLSIAVGKRSVRITSSDALTRTHRVRIDVEVARRLRYDAKA